MIYLVYLINMVSSREKVYHVYKVIRMKKTEYITYRTDSEIKSVLSKIAAEKKWSLSQLSEEIIRQWLEEKHPELLGKQS